MSSADVSPGSELTTSSDAAINQVIAAMRDSDLVIRNEFAYVNVRVVNPGFQPRLLIEDLRTGQRIELDAIELESLAWAYHQDLSPLLDPSFRRWTNKRT